MYQKQSSRQIKLAVREAQQIKLEESFYPQIQAGKMSQSTAHYLTTHPNVLAKWREDQQLESRFNY